MDNNTETLAEESVYEFRIPGRNDGIIVRRVAEEVLKNVVAGFVSAALVSKTERDTLDDEALGLLIDQRSRSDSRIKRATSIAARDVVEWLWRNGYIVLDTSQVALAGAILASRGEIYEDDQHLRTLTLMRFLIPEYIYVDKVRRSNPTPEMLIDFLFYLASQPDEETGFDGYAMEALDG